MSRIKQFYFCFFAMLLYQGALTLRATVLLDDSWADGNRSSTSLPTDSAWYAASSSTLTAITGAMTGTVSSMSHASDYLTASWNIFRNQKKCSLIGHSDNNGDEDTGHLNVRFHHNYYVNIAERMPRMRFGNAHVFNLYCENLGAYTATNNEVGAKGVESTASAATPVENASFYHPQSGTSPTIEVNGGPTGIIKVVNSTIDNLPGVNVAYREFGADAFTFNQPFASPAPPYPYTLDPTVAAPNLVTKYARIGKVGFEIWQMEQFTLDQLANANISSATATPAGDGVQNLIKYALGLLPFSVAPRPLTTGRFENSDIVLTYHRPATAMDVIYSVKVSTDLSTWTSAGVTQQLTATDSNGLQTWEASYSGPASSTRFIRLTVQR